MRRGGSWPRPRRHVAAHYLLRLIELPNLGETTNESVVVAVVFLTDQISSRLRARRRDWDVFRSAGWENFPARPAADQSTRGAPCNPRSNFGWREFGALGGPSLSFSPSSGEWVHAKIGSSRGEGDTRERGIILEFWTPPSLPLSPFLCRFAVNARWRSLPQPTPIPPPSLPNQRPAQRCVHATERCGRGSALLLNSGKKVTQPLPDSKKLPALVCVCMCVFACMPLRVYSFFSLPFRPFYASMAAAPSLARLLALHRRPRSGDIWRQC